MTLTEFLLARIAEDEVAYRREIDLPPSYWGDPNVEYIADLHERLRAECEAKRRIVEAVTDRLFDGVYTAELLSILALPYADHQDYREEWRL